MGLKPKLLPQRLVELMDDRSRAGAKLKTEREMGDDLRFELEKQLQADIACLLNLRGIWYDRKRMDKRSTARKGCPDFLMALNGRAVAVECKVGDNQLSDDQADAVSQMTRNGWECYLVRELQEMRSILDEKPTRSALRIGTGRNIPDGQAQR